MSRVLFILKRRPDYNDHESYSQNGVSTGLYNSAQFVSDMLNKNGIEAKIVVVVDNNGIDREVSLYKPTHVIIEALWVVPEKFEVLRRLHPTVKWIIRFHSETPFIANEGVAMKWFFQYIEQDNVVVSANATRFLGELKTLMRVKGYPEDVIHQKVIFLPNYYPLTSPKFCATTNKNKDTIDVGCFGAIRPLKNHLAQAMAALRFASSKGKKLNFHINTGRVEMKGSPVLHNLEGLFQSVADQGHQLVAHQWSSHEKFIELVKTMDMGLQVSFSETFNIVAADLISNGVPVVSSSEVPWVLIGTADPTQTHDICKEMRQTYNRPRLNVFVNSVGLLYYVEQSQSIWVSTFWS